MTHQGNLGQDKPGVWYGSADSVSRIKYQLTYQVRRPKSLDDETRESNWTTLKQKENL